MIGLKIARHGYAGPVNGADIARHGYTCRSVWEQVVGVILDLFRPAIKSLRHTYQIKSLKQTYQIAQAEGADKMATVNGSVIMRAGSEDPVTLQLLDDDGATPIDLTGISLLTLHLKDISTGTTTTITGSKLTVLEAAAGKIKLSQAAADFPTAARYEYWVSFKDSANKMHYVPEDRNYSWMVKE